MASALPTVTARLASIAICCSMFPTPKMTTASGILFTARSTWSSRNRGIRKCGQFNHLERNECLAILFWQFGQKCMLHSDSSNIGRMCEEGFVRTHLPMSEIGLGWLWLFIRKQAALMTLHESVMDSYDGW